MMLVFNILSYYHVSKLMVRISQLPSLLWSLMPGPKCGPTGYAERLRGVLVDLGDSPRKLGVSSMAEVCWERLTRVPYYPT